MTFPTLDFATWTFITGAAMTLLGLLLTIVITLRGDAIDDRPGRHRADTASGTAAQHLPADDTIDLGLVTA